MQGILSKMTVNGINPVQYTLTLGSESIELNCLIGRKIRLTWQQKIICLHCGKPTKKSFGQGYCFPCFSSIPETDECVLNPEKCQAHLGIARDIAYATQHCLQDHFVYLALSSELKVGVTRQSQIPIRWIDQGAWKAIRLAQTPNRYLAGVMEVALKKHLTDKTNWRNMLKNNLNETIDLKTEKERIKAYLAPELYSYVSEDNSVTEIRYPVEKYPLKPNSINLEKTEIFSGMLTGIKGQYLLLDSGDCLNIRKFGGYMVLFEII